MWPQITASVPVAIQFKESSIESPTLQVRCLSLTRARSLRSMKFHSDIARLLTTEMRYWLKKTTKKKSGWRTPCPLKQAVSLKKKNKMNFGLTPLCLELLCDNDSLLPTHTPAPRAGMMVSKPNMRVAGETHGWLDSSSLCRYMKYIWGTPAILRAHSLAEPMLVEHRCRHQWCTSLEHWYSTSSSSPSWQMEIPGNETCETTLKGWYSHSDYLNPNVENMPKASFLWITVKGSIRGWI